MDINFLAILAIMAFLVGLGKTGLPGISIIGIPVFILLYDARIALGLILIIFLFADCIAVIVYRKYFDLKNLALMIIPAGIGVYVATLLGDVIDDNTFKIIIALFLFISAILMSFKNKILHLFDSSLESSTTRFNASSSGIGFLAGFVSMISNAAAPVTIIYFVLMKTDKYVMIGISAWFYFFINIIKLGFHITLWESVNLETIMRVSLVLPFLFLGAFIGVKLLKIIPKKIFDKVLLIIVYLSAFVLFFVTLIA